MFVIDLVWGFYSLIAFLSHVLVLLLCYTLEKSLKLGECTSILVFFLFKKVNERHKNILHTIKLNMDR